MKRPSIKELDKYEVNYKPDTNFASNARLLQSKWRVKKGYPKNNIIKSNYGNFVETEFAKDNKVNYLTNNIKKLVTEKISEIRSLGGLVGEPRIWNNLLSSQPLCFNLFGELYLDLNLATIYFKKLFPELVEKIVKIDFEFSSKRNSPDNSAFDVYVEYLNKNNAKCFFGIEVKYQEKLTEESKLKASNTFESHKTDYVKMTKDCNYFKEDALEIINKVPLSQIWRDHLLSFNMSNDSINGSFIFLYPFDNDECKEAVNEYKKQLKSSNEEQSHFLERDLNIFIKTLDEILNENWTKELKERYLGE